MAEYARLEIPEDVARDLISDGIAVRPITTRGGGFAETFHIAVDTVNTGAALVSVVVAVNTCRHLAQSFVRLRKGTADKVRLIIEHEGRSESIEVDMSSSDAQETLFDFFAAQLNVE